MFEIFLFKVGFKKSYFSCTRIDSIFYLIVAFYICFIISSRLINPFQTGGSFGTVSTEIDSHAFQNLLFSY